MSLQTKRLVVEFFGLAREIAGVRELEMELEQRATIGEVVRVLTALHPGFVGPIIDGASWTVGPHFLLNLDGREVIQHYDLQPRSGARLLLMSALAGGEQVGGYTGKALAVDESLLQSYLDGVGASERFTLRRAEAGISGGHGASGGTLRWLKFRDRDRPRWLTETMVVP